MTDVPSAELLDRYRRHDAAAAEELFGRYAERLARLVRSRLSRQLTARVDAEDVVQSAYRSFFMLAQDSAVTLAHSGDLWRLLVRITLRKLYRTVRRHRADCRSVEREEPFPEQILSSEPTATEAVALADELRCVLSPLDDVQRRCVEMRLQGHEVEEIAAVIGRSARTVRRTLAGFAAALERRLHNPRSTPLSTGAMIDYADIMLQRQLGEGGMAKVYRARWRGCDHPVAVKLIRKPLRHHEMAVARFRDEAAILARLNHPGMVQVHGLGLLPDGGLFFVMELVDGSDLSRRLASGPISIDQAIRWVAESAHVMDHAHRQGIVHCDLKPSNVLLGADGRIRITDFGLARSLTEGSRPGGGTAGFMAPEQIDPALGPISPRTDVFGLGALLTALLVGTKPLPEPLETVLRRCMEPDQAKRFASTAEVAQALRQLLA